MNVAIIHYHLDHGGVTRVIANQLCALDSACAAPERWRAAVLFGGSAQGWPEDLKSRLNRVDVALRVAPRLAYDSLPVSRPDDLAAQLQNHLRELDFRPADTLLHVHNHGLGKNASLPGALAILAREGFPLLLQMHDFAEDCRPANYTRLAVALGWDRLAAVLYPQAPHIHYAVLNGHDRAILARAGFAKSRLHWLPNPVVANGHAPGRASARRTLWEQLGVAEESPFLLYPVRPIRRKNLGEALLWSVLAGPPTHVGITLAPLNPAEQPCYNHWRQVAVDLRLPVHFEIGGPAGLPLAESFGAADLVLTTSVTEGFGLAFLEAWLAERPLIGRNIPEITADFAAAGLVLESLYDRLDVPVRIVGRQAVRNDLERAWCKMLHSYGQPLPDRRQLALILDERIAGEWVDFADLGAERQEYVLRCVRASSALREEILRANPAVPRALSAAVRDQQATVQRNKKAVENGYALQPSGRALLTIYRRALAAGRSARIGSLPGRDRILEQFSSSRPCRPILV